MVDVPHCHVPHPGWRGDVGIGGLCGLAWAGGLRSFMAAVVGPESQVTWVNTVVWILLVGAVVGALLGSGPRSWEAFITTVPATRRPGTADTPSCPACL